MRRLVSLTLLVLALAAPGALAQDATSPFGPLPQSAPQETPAPTPPPSVEAQQELGLNKDQTLRPKKSEGEKLREEE